MGHRAAVAIVLAVISLTFGLGAKRRAVRSCTLPSLSLSVTPIACVDETVTVTWRASDPQARVHIEGVGTNLRWNGTFRVLDGRRTFSGYAATACGHSEVVAAGVRAPDPPAGTLVAPRTVQQHALATLHITVSDSASWTLTSSLGNPILPSNGIGNEDALYSATSSGTDGLLLQITDRCNTTVERTASLVVEPATVTPPSGSGIRCCDGTRSPSCNSCSNIRGCCSGHGGVCDCGRITPELPN